PPPDIYTLSLHDALPILQRGRDVSGTHLGQHRHQRFGALLRLDECEPVDLAPCDLEQLAATARQPATTRGPHCQAGDHPILGPADRKSTRLNSSHVAISY